MINIKEIQSLALKYTFLVQHCIDYNNMSVKETVALLTNCI